MSFIPWYLAQCFTHISSIWTHWVNKVFGIVSLISFFLSRRKSTVCLRCGVWKDLLVLYCTFHKSLKGMLMPVLRFVVFKVISWAIKLVFSPLLVSYPSKVIKFSFFVSAVNDSNPEGEDHREDSSDCDEMDCFVVSEQPPGCPKEKTLNTSVSNERKMRDLLITIENDTPLEELSKFVDINIIPLNRNRRSRRWYTCPLCGRQFNESSYLISHQRTHTGEKSYDCSHCGKSFNHKTNLNKHERIHTGEKPYSCSKCGKNFRQNSHRSRHEGIHIRKKVFKCPECGKTFPENKEFVLHLQSHVAERPYGCKKCGRRFGRLSNCTRHEKTHSACKTRKQKCDRERSEGPASTWNVS